MRLSLRLGLGLVPQLYTTVSTAALSLSFVSGPIDSRITFTRASLAMRYDSTGKLTYAPNNLLVHSNDPTSALWTKSALSVVGGVSDPDGGNNAFTLTATAASAYILRGSIAPEANAIVSVWLRRRTGVGVVYLNTPQNSLNVTQAITGTWARYSVAGFVSGGVIAFVLGVNVSGDAVDFYCAQSEVVTYETTPRTYNATTGSAFHGARLDHNPATLAPLGLLIEEARTNSTTYSQELDNAAHTKSGTTITANAIVAPDGTTTADRVVCVAGNTEHLVTTPLTTVTAAPWTGSIYVKQDTYRYVSIGLRAFGGSGHGTAVIDLQTGTITQTTSAVGVSAVSSTITSVGSGWFRVTVTGTYGGVYASSGIEVAFVSGPTPTLGAVGREAFVAAVTDTTYFWGAQLEAGAFATSYIPTVAATVTRAADSASMTGTNFSSWYSQTEGTWVVEYVSAGIITGNAYPFGTYTPGLAAFAGIRAGNSQWNTSAGAVAISPSTMNVAAHKISVAYKAGVGETAASIDGNAVTTGTITPPVVNALGIGGLEGAIYLLNGHIKSLTYFKTRKTNAELVTLST